MRRGGIDRERTSIMSVGFAVRPQRSFGYVYVRTGDIAVTLTPDSAAFSGSIAFKVGPMPKGVLPAGPGD